MFKVGDYVITHKPEDTSSGPAWISLMNCTDGLIGEITEVEVDGEPDWVNVYNYKTDTLYIYDISWLEKTSIVAPDFDETKGDF